MRESLPRLLYHGSAHKSAVLQPGINITGNLVQWDETESNEWLYATTDENLAVEMALASSIEQSHLMNRFHTDGDQITIELDMKSPPLTLAMLKRRVVYKYVFVPQVSEGWEKVNNAVNNTTTEWKTERIITVFRRVVTISMFDWLVTKRVIIKHPRFRNLSN